MALSPAAVSRPAFNYWVVACVVVVPTFMEILDTTITNVALRYIAGGLSAAETDADWVITSYLAANAIVLPITGWLSAHLGRRRYFLLSITLFTVASALCGIAGSLGQMIVFRVIQGLAGGGLQPCSQGVLLDAFPPEKQATAMTLFGVAAIIAPIVGPTLGGGGSASTTTGGGSSSSTSRSACSPWSPRMAWSTTRTTSSRSGPS
jgi:DHA2 family multidrug resistance protein